MKRILYLAMFLAAFTGCKKYEYDTTFTAPDELSGTENVVIDLDNVQAIVLSWTGGGTEDGSPVLYDVLFDQPDGDFSSPFYKQAADLGTRQQVTLRHSDINVIARYAGINPAESGSFKWTVRASKGGEMKLAGATKAMNVTRPDALDIPDKLYLFGTALSESENGTEMRQVETGQFLGNVTFAQDGNIWFCDSQEPDAAGALKYWFDSAAGKLMQGSGSTAVTANANLVLDVKVDFTTRSFSYDSRFDAPDELYIQGAVAEAGQHFRKDAEDLFVIYTKFSANGDIFFTTTQDPDSEDAKAYYISEGRLELGSGKTAVTATQYTADRITINATARTMKIEPIGDIELEWVNARNAIDPANPKFAYSSDGNFTLTFDIPADFRHVDEENKGGSASTDARYFIKVNEDPANPVPSDQELKAIPAAERKIKRWGCELTMDYNMTIQPYDRNHTSGITHAAYWIPVFETGQMEGVGVDTEKIITEPYYLYSKVSGISEMPARWKSNWFFKTEWAGSRRTATIYTNKNNVMGIHIE